MAAKPSARTRRDRWADWAVIGVLIVALLLGWGVKALAEGQRTTFADEETGLTVRYPKDWMLKSDAKLVFQAVDPASGDFKTTYQIRAYPIDATASVTSTLSVVLNNASLAQAQQRTAYRLFDMAEGGQIGGQPTMEATYVFVVEGSDLFVQRMPVVVRGLDIAVAQGDTAYVFTLLAADSAFEDAEKGFRRFVEAAEGQ
jgi:hypothetical protein